MAFSKFLVLESLVFIIYVWMQGRTTDKRVLTSKRLTSSGGTESAWASLPDVVLSTTVSSASRVNAVFVPALLP